METGLEINLFALALSSVGIFDRKAVFSLFWPKLI
jgi:hypothetical protein